MIVLLVIGAVAGSGDDTEETGRATPTPEATERPEVTNPPEPSEAAQPTESAEPSEEPIPSGDLLRDPTIVGIYFESAGFAMEDSPLLDGTARLIGQHEDGLVLIEIIDDPIDRTSATGPVLGSGAEEEFGLAIGAQAAIFGDPPGMTAWVLEEYANASLAGDYEASERFGEVVAAVQSLADLGLVLVTFDAD